MAFKVRIEGSLVQIPKPFRNSDELCSKIFNCGVGAHQAFAGIDLQSGIRCGVQQVMKESLCRSSGLGFVQ